MFPAVDGDPKASSSSLLSFNSSPSIIDGQLTADYINDLEQFIRQSSSIGDNTSRRRLANINSIQHVIDLLRDCCDILVLTGAGISVSAGIPDFRSENGLYAQLRDRFNLHDPTTMFDLEYFMQNPALFYSFAGEICPGFDDTQIKYYPTATHYFIRALQERGKLLRNYTQNIDTLEFRAGLSTESVVTCHGSFTTASCVNCQFQCHGVHIQKHIFEKKIPFCPYCRSQQSHLTAMCTIYDKLALNKHQPILTQKSANLLQIRLPKILCSEPHLQTACPILFSFDEDVLRKAVFEADEVGMTNMNFRVLMLYSTDSHVLQICQDAIMQWLCSDKIASFGVMKPDIVFFGESLSADYHDTLQKDIEQCDLMLVLGTSLRVAPVNTLPQQISNEVPIILINREVVGRPNEFDVHLLGNSDDVVNTLLHELKWQSLEAAKQTVQNKKCSDEENIKEECHIVPLQTVEYNAQQIGYEFIAPNYYKFPNGKLPRYIRRKSRKRNIMKPHHENEENNDEDVHSMSTTGYGMF